MISLPRSISEIDLSRRKRLIVCYFIGVATVLFVYSFLYNYGMRVFEGETHSLFRSFQTVAETMTTTGYGADSPWSSPVMNLFVVFMQLTGIALGFFTLRVIIIPLFTGAEVDLDSRLSPKDDHVIICEYRRDSAVLLDELQQLDIEYVLISSSKDNAKELSDAGYSAIHGSPQQAETFERANIDAARAVITDAGSANVNTILTVGSIRPDIDVIALTDDSDMEEILIETGADSVLSPHGVLGHRLAEKVLASFSSEFRDAVALGADIEVTEAPIPHESRLIGTRIRDSQIREKTGANVIGAWIDGELQLPPDPDAVIQPNTVLLVSGGHDALEAFSDFTRPTRTFQQHERIVLAGLGEVGQAAQSVLTEAGKDVVTIDTEEREEVDIADEADSSEVLREAKIENAGAIIVALPDDSSALLTTVLARSLNSNLEILVRVSDTEAAKKALSAGADYVLSVPRVSTRMVAKELRNEDVLAPASQIRLIRVPADPFAGMTLAESNIYEETGCRVVAIEDDSGLSSDVAPRQQLTGDERLVIVGTDEAVQAFVKKFDVSPTETAE